MKVAELFAEIGFKVEGADELKSFEASLLSIANAAREAALALKALAAARIPRQIVVKQGSSSPSGGGGGGISQPRVAPGMLNFIGPMQPPQYSGPLPPKLPPPMPNAVLQGLKTLGAFGLKALGIATVAIALKKLVNAMIDMVKASMQATFAVDKFTTQTGMSRRELKQWERVAELSDVKAEELQETLKQLQQRSRQVRFTGEGATPFLQMGVNAMASPTDMLKQFAQRTKQMDTATAVFWGAQMGISENMVYLLRKNANKLDGLMQGGELNEPEQKAVMELNAAWKELTFTLGLLRDKIVADMAPAIRWVVDILGTLAKMGTGSKDVRDWALHGGPNNLVGSAQLLKSLYAGGSTKVENNVQVDVSGAGSPRETAQATAGALRRELSDSYYGRPPPFADR